MRRRGFGLRRLFQRNTGELADNPNIPPALQHAHELMRLGYYGEAASAFEELASAAADRQGPRAPFLFIQAGRARIMSGKNQAGMAHLRHGLELFAASGRYPQLYRAGTRLIEELQARHLTKEAQEIAGLIQHNASASAESPTQRYPDPAKVSLPTHCPSCGGPLRADEVEWIDPLSAECSFCGSPVRADL